MTFQSLSEEDRKLWLEAMDGKEPVYLVPKAKTEDSTFICLFGGTHRLLTWVNYLVSLS